MAGPRELSADDLHGRPDIRWCLQLDLDGFIDITSRGRAPWLVRIGVREDSVGLTLAHLYMLPLGGDTSNISGARLADNMYDKLAKTEGVDLSSATRADFKDFATVEYVKREIWPMPDAEDSSVMRDSVVFRHHYHALMVYKGTRVEAHLSKTGYLPQDSSLFTSMLSDFAIVDPAPTFDPKYGYQRQKAQPPRKDQ